MSTATISGKRESQANPFAPTKAVAETRNGDRKTADAQSDSQPLFNTSQIAVASFFASPLAGSILLAYNFGKLNQARRGRIAVLLAAGFMLMLIPGIAAIDVDFPRGLSSAIGLLYAAAMALITKTVMGDELKNAGKMTYAFMKLLAVVGGSLALLALYAVMAEVMMSGGTF
ncbi:MAG: hypothetical protein AAF670_17830 [Planctomycetota bacterium]